MLAATRHEMVYPRLVLVAKANERIWLKIPSLVVDSPPRRDAVRTGDMGCLAHGIPVAEMGEESGPHRAELVRSNTVRDGLACCKPITVSMAQEVFGDKVPGLEGRECARQITIFATIIYVICCQGTADGS